MAGRQQMGSKGPGLRALLPGAALASVARGPCGTPSGSAGSPGAVAAGLRGTGDSRGRVRGSDGGLRFGSLLS